jgi:hypothetical protein
MGIIRYSFGLIYHHDIRGILLMKEELYNGFLEETFHKKISLNMFGSGSHCTYNAKIQVVLELFIRQDKGAVCDIDRREA